MPFLKNGGEENEERELIDLIAYAAGKKGDDSRRSNCHHHMGDLEGLPSIVGLINPILLGVSEQVMVQKSLRSSYSVQFVGLNLS